MCEAHRCLIDAENMWRDENCGADAVHMYCANYFECADCPDAWTCDDIEYYTIEAMEILDVNDDGQINYGDL